MSAWLIYVMMLADSISGELTMITIASLACFGASLIGGIMTIAADDKFSPKAWSWIKRSIIVFSVSLSVNAFVPSTKTVAMMIVIPRLATDKNLDAMGAEAKDVYELAKKALENAANGDKK